MTRLFDDPITVEHAHARASRIRTSRQRAASHRTCARDRAYRKCGRSLSISCIIRPLEDCLSPFFGKYPNCRGFRQKLASATLLFSAMQPSRRLGRASIRLVELQVRYKVLHVLHNYLLHSARVPR
jgi:hypothetical protein